MASSDDEDEFVPHTVSNYHFVDGKNEPVSFSDLPVEWNDGESSGGKEKEIFLHGYTDNGLQKIYKQVKAWKFDLSSARPELSVLSKENNWIVLLKPRKSFEDTIRTILITVHCLHFVKQNPETSGRSLWEHLSKVFSSYETRPSENDLVDHIPLINEAVKRDEALAKSKFLITFLDEKPNKRKAVDEDAVTSSRPGFIVDDDIIEDAEEDGSDEEGDLFDSVCAICDNGGELLCCEGRCMRSFHATVEAGSESMCKSLGLSDERVEAIQNFFCKNCLYKQHQCFSCGELGSSDKSSGAEVFPCVSATCGRFYHPHCVAKLLHRESETDALELQKKIAAGESFTCPVHKCHVCKQGENKMDPEFQFAICRRCPKSYHRKCLPRKIAFEDMEDEGIIQRAWEGLMPNRILIYCLKHAIDGELGTPIRNHIKFPKIGEKKKTQLPSSGERVPKAKSLASEDASSKKTVESVLKRVEKLSSSNKVGASSKRNGRRLTGSNPLRKQKVLDTCRKHLNKTVPTKVNKFATNENSLGNRLYALISNSRKEDISNTEHEQALTAKPVAKEMSSLLPLDADTEKRLTALVKDASSSITLDEITKKYKVPVTHAYSSKNHVDKNITLGKVEGSVEALRAALQKLEEGCSIEDAKAVCEPGLLNQLSKWKNKLKVYLAPFLFGMRYTSFGRHFTKVEKLKEIVDVIHWYVKDSDTIVDFCCGANDFSCLLKKKLDETGKKCSFKNYDILQTKNDFCFEKRDWMTVRPMELPTGSQLIMGLNPPFGVNAALANKFIDKALEFKPKLLVLIVPRETERLDKKEASYDLVWEDDELLAGKSFYLPGSVDVNDKQIDQWNVNPPPLYLWSRPDWTAKHKEIAQQHGHSSRVREESCLEENYHEMLIPDLQMEDCPSNAETMPVHEHPVQFIEPEKLLGGGASVPESNKEDLLCINGDREGQENNGRWKDEYREGHENNGCGKDQYREGHENSSRGKERHREGHENSSHGKEQCREGHENSSRGKERHREGHENNGHRKDHYRKGHGNNSRDKYRSYENPKKRQRDKVEHGGGSSEILPEDKQSRQGSPIGGLYKGLSHHSSPMVIRGKSLDGRQSELLETSMHAEFGNDDYQQHSTHSGAGPLPQFQKGYGGTWATDNMTNRYGLAIEEPYPAGTRRWSGGASPGPDYGIRNPDQQFAGYRRGNTDGHGYRPYSGLDEKYRWDSDIRTQVRLFGQQEPDYMSPSSSFLANQNSGFSTSHEHMGPPAGMMSTSTMQRYAPRLDELNHTRPNSLRFEPPPPPPPPMARNDFRNLPPPGGFHADSSGFAPGPFLPPYSRHNSSGWLNE